MNCPKCKTRLGKRTSNAPFSCRVCGGIWLLPSDAPDLLEIGGANPAPTTPNDLDDRTGLCPSGHGLMLRARVETDEPFHLERCTACGGIWFDQGEWHRIVENNLTTHLSEIWSRSWQQKQRALKNREDFLRVNQERLGREIFDSVISLAERLKNHPQKSLALALLQQEIL